MKKLEAWLFKTLPFWSLSKNSDFVIVRPPCHSPIKSGNPEGMLGRAIQNVLKKLDSRFRENDYFILK